MALATYVSGGPNKEIIRYSDASTANAIVTVTTPTGRALRLLMVTVKYSGAPTQAGVTTEIDSGIGAAYDAIVNTGSANALTTVFIPTTDLIISDTDAFKVTAPAGGGSLTGQISVYVEPYF